MDRQRIDKWLWHARVVRTRTAAADLVGSGLVRLNGARSNGASQPVRPGDVITVALDRSVRVLRVTGFAERRGSATLAQALFEDLTPPATPVTARPAQREPGTGRPTDQTGAPCDGPFPSIRPCGRNRMTADRRTAAAIHGLDHACSLETHRLGLRAGALQPPASEQK